VRGKGIGGRVSERRGGNRREKEGIRDEDKVWEREMEGKEHYLVD